MNQKERFELKRSLKYDKVYDIDGTFLGYAGEVLPKKMLDLRFGLLQFDDFRLKDIIYVECPVCGLRSVSLKSHKCQFDGPRVPKGKVTIKCERCGREETFNNRTYAYRVSIGKHHLCTKCMTEETCMDRYGAPNQMASKNFREKRKQTWLDKYGVDNPWKSDEVKEKIKETNLERYGAENPLGSEQGKAKKRNTNLKRYGNEVASKSDEVQAKMKATSLERYGSENPFGSEQIKEKRRKTNFAKYGNEVAAKSDIVRENLKKRLYEKYGITSCWQIPEVKKKIAKNRKFPKTEKRLIEMFKNRGINYIHQFEFNHHLFDFAVLDNADNLVALVDVDGSYYHGYLTEANGKNMPDTTYNDAKRAKLAGNIKFICINDLYWDEGVSDLLETLNIDYNQYLTNIFEWCRKSGIPLPTYSNKILKESWNRLCTYKDISPKANTGLQLVKHFHHSIYYANRQGYDSPVTAFNDDKKLWKAVKNRFIYKNTLDPSTIFYGLNIAKISPIVSVFHPSLAKYLVEKYLSQYTQIFDPFSGFSGRMLGTMAAGKEYIGQDCNETTINESMNLAQFLGIQPHLMIANSIETAGKYECLFTCPPYNLKENWGQEIENHSCDEWIDICLRNYDCQTYLFVVDNTKKYKEHVVETIKNQSHFNENSEYIVLIHKQ